VKHPAKFPDIVLSIAYELLGEMGVPEGARGLDPFAGTGKGCDYFRNTPWPLQGIELESEWVEMSDLVQQGDALSLPFPDGMFRWVLTSPCYGNRMADSHEAKDDCKSCNGAGARDDGTDLPCRVCEGTGLSKRNTYRHVLGHRLSEDSSAGLQWGGAYRAFHEAAWEETTRVCAKSALFLLNIKDHIRKGEVQEVSRWHVETLEALGWELTEECWIPTPGNRYGANSGARLNGEWLFGLVRP
jgi:hypothetical protein